MFTVQIKTVFVRLTQIEEAVAECEENENGQILLGRRGGTIGREPQVEDQQRN